MHVKPTTKYGTWAILMWHAKHFHNAAVFFFSQEPAAGQDMAGKNKRKAKSTPAADSEAGVAGGKRARAALPAPAAKVQTVRDVPFDGDDLR